MGGWALVMVAALLAGTALDARAQGTSFIASSRCGSEAVAAGEVASVVDGRSFRLADGREIRLAGIEVPSDDDRAQTGVKALTTVLAGQTVELRAAGASDRYGRTVAYARTTGDQGQLVGHALLAEGHARVSAQVGDPACAAELLSRERVARTAKRGLWADPRYGIMDAGKLTDLVAGRGRFAVIEGNVVSVRQQGGTIYVNFGRRWSQALTVTISKRQEGMFASAGFGPKALENKRLRVRGWIDIRNGPRIEVSRPEQIEIAGLN